MLIGLISDTHIPDRAKEIPEKVFEAFSEVDLIMHAGDLTSPKVIDDLEQIALDIKTLMHLVMLEVVGEVLARTIHES